MSLGSGFPPGYLRDRVLKNLRPGSVIKLVRRMDDGKVHEKRYVVIHIDDRTVTCVINSVISGFIRRRPALLQCQVLMHAASHGFMQHDSHVDCSRPRSYATDEVIRDLVARPEWILGQITTDLKSEIIGALKFAPTLAPAELELLSKSLESG